MTFYTYMWLRENGTPYYIGKGSGSRGYTGYTHNVKCPNKERIVIYPAESEAEAFETEIALIWYYGRKDLGLGCLRNLTDGGENPPNRKGLPGIKSMLGRKHSEQSKEKMRKPKSEETCRRISEGSKGKSATKGTKGYKHSYETRRKISEAGRGRVTFLGRKHSEEAKQKISDVTWQRYHVFIV